MMNRIEARRKALYGMMMLLLLVTGCDRRVLYDESRHIAADGWSAEELLSYDVKATDTSKTYLCCIDLRNTNDYPFSNIYLSIKTIFPDGSVAADTNIEFILAERDGRWLGRQTGSYVDGRYPFGYLHFPMEGEYRFVVGHAMRDTLLSGIKDVGIHIEETEK